VDGEDLEVLDVGESGDEGSSAQDVQVGDEPGAGDSASEGDSEASQEESQEQAGQDAADKGDGRKVAAVVRQHLAEVKKTNPVLAKELERIYWKGQAIDKLGTTQELTALKEAVELHGGVEGLSQMAEEVQAGRQLEEGFKRGDPKVIEGWATDFPDGFKKLVLPALDRLERMDPAFHEQAVSTVSTKFLEKYGVFDAVGQMGEALRNGKTDDAIRLYNDLVGKVFQPMRGLATKAATDPLASEREQINSQREELAKQEKAQFYGSVRSEVNQQVGRAMNAEIGKLLRGRKLDPEMGNRVRSEVTEEIKKLLVAQADYAKRYETIMGAGNRDKAIKFIVDNAQRNMPKAVQTVLKYRNLLGTNSNGARPPAKVAPKGAPQTVVGRPSIADVDFTKTDKATFLGSRQHGRAFLRSGKIATW
jgi:hypothetical protein